MQKLIGNQPLVIHHKGQVKSNPQAKNRTHANPSLEDSVADLSMANKGDISVQVVQDVQRVN